MTDVAVGALLLVADIAVVVIAARGAWKASGQAQDTVGVVPGRG